MTENKKVRVRYAPSPTGPLHMGGVRTALYNYLFARKHGGDFVLRIEDTDQGRFVPGAEKYIIESLKWCGICPGEGIGFGEGPYAPYRQSERKPFYRQYADQLVRSGHAYYAFDTPEELEAMRKRMEAAKVTAPAYNAVTREHMKNALTLSEDEINRRISGGEHYVIRIKIPRNEEIRLHDIIRGWVVVHSSSLDDKVLFKSDGMPTYHLANVVDDYLMKISHVIRGEEWLPSAPLHVLLYRYLGWEDVMPQFAHLPLVLRPDGNGKLSKRDGDRLGFPVFPLEWQDPFTKEVSSGYRERGYIPEGFMNMLALLGWHPSGNNEIFSMDELVREFSLDRVSKAGAKFDPEKAKWFNQQYLRMKSDEELASVFVRELEKQSVSHGFALPGSDYIQRVCGLIKEKAAFIGEFWNLGSYFFMPPAAYDEEVIKKRWTPAARAFFSLLRDNYASAMEFTAPVAENIFKSSAGQAGINPGQVMQLFRVIISGIVGGPALFDTAELLGKEAVVTRIEAALQKFT